jgi:DNA-binding response OmpR family regulator
LKTVLLVEDDRDISTITKIRLEHAGYETDTAYTCSEALDKVRGRTYDLILLDVMLPDGSGSELCPQLRTLTRCPVIFVSCLDDSGTVVSALRGGGDDYVVKPIKFDELLARIETNIRRSEPNMEEERNRKSQIRRFRHFSLDTLRRKVLLGSIEADLSSIEYNLLLYMAEHPDTLLLYDDLYSQVWSNDSLGDVRTVMVHISNLRKKIDPDKIGIIETVRGAGYIFSDI